MSNTQMIIRLDEKIKLNLARLAKADGKNSSLVIRELIENYVQERNTDKYIDDLWKRIGRKLTRKKIKHREIEKAIRDVRAAKK